MKQTPNRILLLTPSKLANRIEFDVIKKIGLQIYASPLYYIEPKGS
jgi:hypothetical protein